MLFSLKKKQVTFSRSQHWTVAEARVYPHVSGSEAQAVYLLVFNSGRRGLEPRHVDAEPGQRRCSVGILYTSQERVHEARVGCEMWRLCAGLEWGRVFVGVHMHMYVCVCRARGLLHVGEAHRPFTWPWISEGEAN